MKEMMIVMPMVTVPSYEDLNMARFYPKTGRYIVKLDNDDIVVADVILKPLQQGELRPNNEQVQSLVYCPAGQPELLDPKEWVPAIDLENTKLAYEADSKRMEEQMREANERHEAETASLKAEQNARCEEIEKNCKKLIDETEEEYQRRVDALNNSNEQQLTIRRMELEHEYEKKKMQLELDTPKRFAQGEWVSGKTLIEVVKALTAGKQENCKDMEK